MVGKRSSLKSAPILRERCTDEASSDGISPTSSPSSCDSSPSTIHERFLRGPLAEFRFATSTLPPLEKDRARRDRRRILALESRRRAQGHTAVSEGCVPHLACVDVASNIIASFAMRCLPVDESKIAEFMHDLRNSLETHKRK